MRPRIKRFKIGIPIGAIASFVIMIYLITHDIWNKLSMPLKLLAIIGLILLFFCGDIGYETEVKVNAT